MVLAFWDTERQGEQGDAESFKTEREILLQSSEMCAYMNVTRDNLLFSVQTILPFFEWALRLLLQKKPIKMRLAIEK